ncbi:MULTISPECIES: class I SAM-dependent methyltransferase [unclassified Frankia]|uniref:class I SAM-dependent methyltransferase n=1 Tax=unclassified Frankia TaxID=2632575 RepID=UPI001EF3F6BD|nr:MULTISPECIES: class I SAM-dependent methyltransferase [unclassified Frankia]
MTDIPPVGTVRLSIPGAVAVARRSCSPSCFGYHATWRLFRLTGLKANPAWHARFYHAALADLRDSGGRLRVLICAASDETMLATLTQLLGRHRFQAHMVDACATPLALAAAYAHQHGIAVTTQQASAPQLPDLPGPFEVAVTDGLLSLLSTQADRDTLLARLASLLTPTGLLLYTTRIAGPAGILEYDRLGRAVQAAAIRVGWPGSPRQRRNAARRIRTQPSRRSPFATPGQAREAFAQHFAHVTVERRSEQPSLALRLHPSAWTGQASYCLDVTAHTPTLAAVRTP